MQAQEIRNEEAHRRTSKLEVPPKELVQHKLHVRSGCRISERMRMEKDTCMIMKDYIQ